MFNTPANTLQVRHILPSLSQPYWSNAIAISVTLCGYSRSFSQRCL